MRCGSWSKTDINIPPCEKGSNILATIYVCQWVQALRAFPCICIYIYIYIKWTVFVNVTTKSAQHAHARMIAIIVDIWLEFGLFSTIIAIIRACACWALFVVTLTNTVHLIYSPSSTAGWALSCQQPVFLSKIIMEQKNFNCTYDLSLDFFQQLYIYIYICRMTTRILDSVRWGSNNEIRFEEFYIDCW